MFPFHRKAIISSAMMFAVPAIASLYAIAVYAGFFKIMNYMPSSDSNSFHMLNKTLDRFNVKIMKDEILFAFYWSKIAFPVGWTFTAAAMFVEKEIWSTYMNKKSHHFYERLFLVSFCTSIICIIYMYVGIEITHGSKIIATVFSGSATALIHALIFIVSLYFCVIEMIFAIYGWQATSWQVRGPQ